ncbi:MAG: hypothetical protein MRY64_15000 [Hyphomonadaceae bacterium]|nr:hypothetical protein [Hyphomonadaceae bacterium]
MKKLVFISAMLAAGCQTVECPEVASTAPEVTEAAVVATPAPKVAYDAAVEEEIGTEIGYIFAAPEKVYTRIGREFPAFDSDYSGELNSYEFAKWLIPLRELRAEFDETDLNMSDEDLEAWAEGAHAFADADSNGEVGYEELADYFGGI